MKLLVPLIVVGVIICVVLFIAGVLSPSRSRRWEELTGRWFRKAERKSDDSAGRAGDMTREAFSFTRRATEKSAAGGRELHARLPPGRSEQKGRPEKDLPFDPDQ